MNRAQKNAWFGLGFCLIADVLVGFMLSLYFIFPTVSYVLSGVGIILFFFIALLLCSVIFRKKKNEDIELDERDRQINNTALRVCFVSVWPLLILANIVSIYFCDATGPIPAVLFAFIHLWVFVTCATDYFISILVRHRTQGDAA